VAQFIGRRAGLGEGVLGGAWKTRAGNGLDAGAYRCAAVAVRNRQNQLRPSSPLWPVATRRVHGVNAGPAEKFETRMVLGLTAFRA
jgi:hypothetical protein